MTALEDISRRGSAYTVDMGGNVYLTGATFPVYSSYMAKTDTVKRPFPHPADLRSGTAFVFEKYVKNHAIGTWYRMYDQYVSPCSEYYTANRNSPAMWGYEDFSVVDGKLRAKIKSSNLNLAQSLAEYRQTSSMFSEIAKDSVQFFRSLRRGDIRSAAVTLKGGSRWKDISLSKGAANRWLQYQYGLKPLVSDIYGSAEALAVKLQGGITRYVHARHGGEETLRTEAVPYNGNPSLSYRVNSHRWRQQVTAAYTIQDTTIKQLSQVGIANPALLAWELIPYSFVFDWLFPVGNWLSSLDALVGVSNLVVQRSYMRIGEALAVGNMGVSSEQYIVKQRFAPDDQLSLPPLGYKPSTSLMAVTNGLALLAQLRAGR